MRLGADPRQRRLHAGYGEELESAEPPLTGAGTHVKFNTREDAIHFCEKQGTALAPGTPADSGAGFEYYVQEPQKAKFKPKNYSSYVERVDQPR